MICIDLKNNKGYTWYSDETVWVKGTALNSKNESLQEESLLNYFKNTRSEEEFKEKLLALNGLFSVIIQTSDKVLAAVDRLRNFPLLYRLENGTIHISDRFESFLNNQPTLNPASETAMRYIGWVPGKQTLFKEVFQIRAGEYLSFSQNQLKTEYWYEITPSVTESLTKKEWKEKIRECFWKIGERLITNLNNRPVLLPLSGGFDSRMIALLLKKNGYNDVFCFTYGNAENIEIRNSKKIAEKLGFRWKFYDYKPLLNEDYIHSSLFREYMHFASNAISFPYMYDFFAARSIRSEENLPENSVVLPGHSGDAAGGNHYLPDLTFSSKEDCANKIFRLYAQLILPDPKEKKQLLKLIANEISENQVQKGYLAYEDWNIKELQAKQLVNSSKVYNFFGYKYLLPLEDNDFLELFASLPLKYKAHKWLYDETIKEIYAENGLLLPDEMSPTLQERKRRYLKLRIKDYFPFVTKFKKYQVTPSFYYFDRLVQSMIEELAPTEKEKGTAILNRIKNGNGIITAWYIEQFKREFIKV